MAQALQNGTTLQDGKYKIISFLGQGGFGITYLAENIRLDKKVAVKEFFPKDFCDREETSHLCVGTESNRETVEKLKDRFLKEARNIAKIDFPGIVKIFDIFKENNTFYYVMEYIEGENLNDLVKKNGPLSEDKTIKYIKGVGEALEHIHSKNMTHFDVKPSNIVIRKSDDKPILIDFGLSKQYNKEGEATSTLLHGVSKGYSPIELYNADENLTFSPQTDVYSLAATLYFLLEGKTPPASLDLITKKLEFYKIINTTLKEVIIKGMSYIQRDRYESIQIFLSKINRDTEETEIFNNTQLKLIKNKNDQCFERNKIYILKKLLKNLLQNKIIRIVGIFFIILVLAIFIKIYSPQKKYELINGFLVEWSKNTNIKQRKYLKQLIKNMVLIEEGVDIHSFIGVDYTLIHWDKRNHNLMSPPGEQINDSTEIKTIFISKFEVSQELWNVIMGYNPSTHKEKNGPVTNVSIQDIKEFIKNLNNLSNLKFRLPEEREWEFIYKGGKFSLNYIFSGGNNADEVAWFKSNSQGHLHRSGKKKPNELGIYDMEGNVSEWVFCPIKEIGEIKGSPKNEYGYFKVMGANWDTDLGIKYYDNDYSNDYNYTNVSHETDYNDIYNKKNLIDDDLKEKKSNKIGFRLVLEKVYDSEKIYSRPKNVGINADIEIDTLVIDENIF